MSRANCLTALHLGAGMALGLSLGLLWERPHDHLTHLWALLWIIAAVVQLIGVFGPLLLKKGS